MSNKLKNVFNSQPVNLGGTFHFVDASAHKEFLEALDRVNNEGKTIKVSGVTGITAKLRDGDYSFPLMEDLAISDVYIGPSFENETILAKTPLGEKAVVLQRYKTADHIVLQTENESVAYIRFEFYTNSQKVNFAYKIQLQFAKSIESVINDFCCAIGIFDFFFAHQPDEETSDNEIISNSRKALLIALNFWRELFFIEKTLGTTFDLKMVNGIDKSIEEVSELYLLIVKKQVIRVNAKLTSTESTNIVFNKDADCPLIGHPIDLVFCGKSEYMICGQTVSVYTAGLLSNAIVKDIQIDSDGTKRVLYGDTDSSPMYVTFTAFCSAEEAEEEMKQIMGKKAVYRDALTTQEQLHGLAGSII